MSTEAGNNKGPVLKAYNDAIEIASVAESVPSALNVVGLDREKGESSSIHELEILESGFEYRLRRLENIVGHLKAAKVATQGPPMQKELSRVISEPEKEAADQNVLGLDIEKGETSRIHELEILVSGFDYRLCRLEGIVAHLKADKAAKRGRWSE